MGSSMPQVEDMNNDGHLDIINSSYYCDILYWKGNDSDTLSEHELFKLEDGSDLTYEEAVSSEQINGRRVYGAVDVHDWNEDGLLDILFTSGHVSLEWYENIGTKEEPLFKAGQKIQLNGTDIMHERPSVEVFDINLDGKKDLIFGTQKRGFYLLNSGTNESPEFTGEEHDFYYGDSLKIEMDGANANPIHGEIQVHVTDWNSDGFPDLLVGENCGWTVDPPFEMLYLFKGVPDGEAVIYEETALKSTLPQAHYNSLSKTLTVGGVDRDDVSLSLLTIGGREVVKKSRVDDSGISLNGLSRGVYLVELRAGNSTIRSQRIIIE